MQKIKYKKAGYYILLSVIAATGMAYCFWKTGMFPFGENSNLFSDLATQYSSFLVFFRNSTLGEKIFSLTKGFGGQTWGLLTYYTFSPFNFITYLFKPEDIEMALFAIFIARAVFMAVNMNYYLENHFDDSLMNMACALMYTFYPFFTRYYFNVLWMDCFALLPLVILGTERIMNGKSGKLFIFAYTYCLVSNYYIAYMVSLFVLCWFVYKFIMEYGFNIKLAVVKAFKMAYYAVISIMLSAPVLVPSFYMLAQGKFNDDTISSWRVVKPYHITTSPVVFFEGVIVHEYTPHLVGTVVCIFLLLAYVLNKKINKKEKLITSVFFAFMFAGFAFRILGYVWHGFSAPQGFHNRQTFLYAFLMLVICRVSAEAINWDACKKTLVTIVPLYIFAAIYTKKLLDSYISIENAYITMVSVAVVSLCFFMVAWKPELAKKALAIYLCAISVYMGGYYMAGQYKGDSPYTMSPESGKFKENYILMQSLIEEIDDDSFYRMEDPTRWSQNQAMALNYYSTSHYSSTFESMQKEMFMYYGYADTYYSTTYVRSLPLNDFVFGVKYVISNDTSLVTNHYSVVFEGDKNIYYNPFWIPVVYTGATNDVAKEEYWVDTVNNMTIALTGLDIYRRDGNADYDKLKIIASEIREKAASLEENSGNYLKFKTENTEDAYLLSSLLYDENWHIKVNGKEVLPERYMEYFLSVPLEKETTNTIEMTYIPQGLLLGIAIMAAAVAILGIHMVVKYVVNKRRKYVY